ncbi:CitMHS family transporter [Alkaliphilus transvaalensis]|uniref:CitMHS family transporter n=1 Tax=Alkaliphilus transvaalensis TaxID=114628 RepID=UPI00047A153F|nr:citrate:proton symporter [Alkaliphilus transvaalensis]
MLALLGFITIIVLLALVMSKKASPVVVLIVVPIITGLIGGFGKEVGTFITNGIRSIAPTGTMFIFAILFFGILTDAGTFQPIVNKILTVVGKDPVKIAIGTVILSTLVHLDGSGATSFLIAIPALLPLYDALGMRRQTLATIVALSVGVMNIVPWGGPTLRAASALDVSATELFNPIFIPFIAGMLFVIFIAYRLGKKEQKLIAHLNIDSIAITKEENAEQLKLARPHLFYLNIAIIIATLFILIREILAPHVIFMLAFAVAITINYPNVKEQRERIDSHAKAALMMASILFAAGAFIGIMTGSGMIGEMANFTVSIIPQSLGKFIPVLTGVIAMPASLLFDPDSFYFGVLPVLAQSASEFGIEAVNVGRAAILGQMTTGFPVSPLTGATFLLLGLTGVDLGEHQKKTIPYAFATTIVMLIVALLVGGIKL